MFKIKNVTPYKGVPKLKFERFPYYTGGGSVLNKVHINLKFIKLVSRLNISIIKNNNDDTNVDPEKLKLIREYTGGIVGTYYFNDGSDNILENSFMHPDGTYLGDIETAWWYYNQNMIISNIRPHGVGIVLKKGYTLKDYLNGDDVILGYYGFTHRGGSMVKIGDMIYDENFTMNEFHPDFKKYKEKLNKSKYSTRIEDIVPFNRHGNKVVTTWEEAELSAINISKSLS